MAQLVPAVAAACLMAVWTATGAAAAPAPGAPTPDNGPTIGGTSVTGTVPVYVAMTGQWNGNAAFALTNDGSVLMTGSCGPLYVSPTLIPSPEGGVVFTSVASFGWCSYGAQYGASDFYALASDGTIWGGRPGLATGVWQQVPSPGGLTFTAVSAGYLVGYGIASNGTVWAWGSNAMDQFGDGTGTDSATPVKVLLPPDKKFVAVSSSVSTGQTATMLPDAYALADDGSIWAWGGNEFGQLGNGDTVNQSTPVQVNAPGVKFTAVATSQGTAYALDDAGNLWTWGSAANGPNSSVPVKVAITTLPAGVTPTAIAVGSQTNYLLASDGTVWSWGTVGSSGNIGTTKLPAGTNNVPPTDPVQVETPPGMKFTAISAGIYTGYALADDGSLYSWGFGGHGQLGIGRTAPGGIKTPQKVTPPVTITGVTFGGEPGTGLTRTGNKWTVTTPGGCGPVDVVVSYRIGTVQQPDLTFPGGFTYGEKPQITATSSQTGNVFTASVTVTAGDDTPTVQWQKSYDGSTWIDIPGATGTTLTATVTQKTDFRAAVTNCWTGVEADFSAVLSDDPPPRPPVDPPQNHTAETGGSAASDAAGLAVVAASLTVTGGLALAIWRRRIAV